LGGQSCGGAPSCSGLLGPALGLLWACSGVNDAVQAEGNGGAGALPWRAFDAEDGAVGRSQRPRQRQAEPEARAIAAKPAGVARGGTWHKGFMRGHAGPGIGDADVQSRTDAGDGNGHAVALPRELDGVGEQVEQHLLEAQLVGNHTRKAGRELGQKHEARPLGERTHNREAALDHARGLKFGHGERRHERTRRVAAQQAVNHTQPMACALVDIACVTLVARARKRTEVFILEDLGVGDDGAERRAQLVRQPGIECHGQRVGAGAQFSMREVPRGALGAS
jgi:hypothetical protein